MWGAIIGDLAGSVYEYQQYKKISPIEVDKLITENSFYTDDTILTVALYEAIYNQIDYGKILKMYGKSYMNYVPSTNAPHFKMAFGNNFLKWIQGEEEGKSIGNGAMMRISPIGKMFNTEKDVIEQAMLATKPSHDTIEAIECSRIVALIIYYARMGLSKCEIRNKLDYTILEYKPFEKFNKTCYETLNNCLFAVFESNNFEEALKMVISFGGDTDTNGAIVGSMAEALYGIPEYLVRQAKRKLPGMFTYFIDKAYK